MYTRVKELREQRGLSQLSLGLRVGCSQNTISKIEKGEIDPRAGVLLEMARYFGVSVDYLLGASNIKTYVELNLNTVKQSDIAAMYQQKLSCLSRESQMVVGQVIERLEEMESNLKK